VGAGVIAGLIASGVVIWDQVIPHRHQAFAFTNLSSDGATPESCAFTAKGEGTPPPGRVIVVSNQVQGVGDNIDHLLHFGRANKMPNTNNWYADVQIGISSTKPGTTYTLTAWLADAHWVDNKIRNTPGGHAWWPSDEPPPGAQKIASATVTRTANANCWPLSRHLPNEPG
jgi:hypothetical protein